VLKGVCRIFSPVQIACHLGIICTVSPNCARKIKAVSWWDADLGLKAMLRNVTLSGDESSVNYELNAK
jgi:hypothetical protein